MSHHKPGTFWSTILSVMLILFGFLLLLDTFNILNDATELFLAAIFGFGAFVSLSFYLQHRQNWWALIPGGILLGLSGFFLIDAFPSLNRQVDEVSFMMFAFALAFWVIFATERRQRWAIIPAGLFTFVALIITFENPEFFLALLFGLASFFGFQFYAKNHKHWWILLPSSALLGVSAILASESMSFLSRRIEEGSLMLFALALGFWLIYISHGKHGWAAIPAGILTTLGFLVAIERFIPGNFEGPFLMIGFGLTFGMLWVRRKLDDTGWAIWPASILLAIGLFIAVAEYADKIWPFIFIGVGGWLIWRNFAQNRKINPVNGTPPNRGEFEFEQEEHPEWI